MSGTVATPGHRPFPGHNCAWAAVQADSPGSRAHPLASSLPQNTVFLCPGTAHYALSVSSGESPVSFEVLGPTALGIAEGLAGVTLPQAVFREGGEGRLPLGLAGRRDTVSGGV